MIDVDRPCLLWVCIGSPSCELEPEDVINAQLVGCRFCSLIALYEDGTEKVVREPNPAAAIVL